MTRHTLRFALFAAVAAVGMGAALLALNAERPPAREIEVVIKGMTFYVGDDPAPNPPIHLAPGESVLVTVSNEDTGIVHDFAIPEWAAATRRLRGGESERITLQAPDVPGTASYECSPHSKMMRGRIEVR